MKKISISRLKKLVAFNIHVPTVKQLIPTDLLNTVLTISDKRADKTTEQCRTKTQLKLTRLQRIKDRRKPDDNWVRVS